MTDSTQKPEAGHSSQSTLSANFDSTTARMNASLSKPQLNEDGHIRHFLGIEGLSREQLKAIIAKAESFFDANGQLINSPELDGCTVMNLFFEPSTRTRTTFEVAEKRLGANVLNIDIARSSTQKGESLRDTLWNLQAMTADIFVVRHSASGAAHFMATEVTPEIAIINGGDGWHGSSVRRSGARQTYGRRHHP